MTAKPKISSRLESDIEKFRDESNWRKVLDLAEQLRSRSPGRFETLVNFLIGECKLEQFIEENPNTEFNISRAKTHLLDAKRHLQLGISEQGQKLGLVQNAYVLLGKIHFATGAYEDALNHLHKAGLENIPDRNLGVRQLKILAEAHAMQAACLEKTPPISSSKYKAAEREQQITISLELASDLALLYLQEQDKLQGQGTLTSAGNTVAVTPGSTSPLPPPNEHKLGPILEVALQRAPIMHIKNGQLQKAISQYRNVLSAVESSATQHLRLTLARQLAEVLLRGITVTSYTKPNSEVPVDTTVRLNSATDSPWKPRKYSGQNLFVPADINEEVILLLLISEAMAVKEAVLSRSVDHKEARIHSFNNATSIYDLLALILVRRGQFAMLTETFDRAMKFSFEEFHVWFQFALSLIAAGKHARALLVLKECINMDENNPLPCLMAAKLCYENLSQTEEGVKFAQKALDREKCHSQGLAGRCHVALGLGYMFKADHSRLKLEKQGLTRKVLDMFTKAQHLDSNDYLAEFYLGLHYAQARQIPEAIFHVKTALLLRPEHVHSLHLLILLLSAQKQYEEALQLAEAALEEYPDNLNLMYVKAHLEECVLGGEVALLTSKHMLRIWKHMYEEETHRDETPGEHKGADTKSLFQFYSSEVSDRDSSSIHGNSLATSRVEQALSEVASSMSSYHPRPGPQHAWLLQIQIWLLLARLYLKMEQISEASACVQEASSIFHLSHHVMYMRGLIYEHKREFHDAKSCYQNAIAVNPLHIKSLQHLGLVYHYLGTNQLAEKTLQDAVKIDSLCHKTWFNMGKVLEANGDYESASECLATAIDLEATSPILPFSSIPRLLE